MKSINYIAKPTIYKTYTIHYDDGTIESCTDFSPNYIHMIISDVFEYHINSINILNYEIIKYTQIYDNMYYIIIEFKNLSKLRINLLTESEIRNFKLNLIIQ